MRSSLILLSLILSTIGVLIACTAMEQIPDMAEGDLIRVEAFGFGAGIEKLGDGTTIAKADADMPSNLYVEVVTADLEIFSGVIEPGKTVILPPGARTLTATDTAATATNTLVPAVPPTGGGGGKMAGMPAQGGGLLEQVIESHLVWTMSVDGPSGDDWDTVGCFTLTAGSVQQAHQLIRTWVDAHGQGSLVNSLISEIHYAYTTQFVQNRQGVVFRITALNDQRTNVAGSFDYESGGSVALPFPTMQPSGSLWETSLDIDSGLFPVGVSGLTESFMVRMSSANRTDGQLLTSLGVLVQGAPVL